MTLLLALLLLAGAAVPAAADDVPQADLAKPHRCVVAVFGKHDGDPHERMVGADAADPAGIWLTPVGTQFIVAPGVDALWLFDFGVSHPGLDLRTTEPDRSIRVTPGQRLTVPAATDAQAEACRGRSVS